MSLHYDRKRKCNVAIGSDPNAISLEDLVLMGKLGIVPDAQGHIHRDPDFAKKLELMAKDHIEQFGEESAYGHVVRSNDRIARMHELEAAKVKQLKSDRSKILSNYL